MKFRAEMGHWSSIVGNSVHLIGEDGRFLGQIAIMCQDDRLREKDVQTELCEKICTALNADLCASGQVRALEWEQVDPNAVLGHGIEPCQYYIRYEVGSWWMPGDAEVEDAQEFDDLEAAKAAAQADYKRRILAALTTAPQPDTCWRCGGTGLALNYAGEPGLCSTCKGDTVTVQQPSAATPPQPSETVAEALENMMSFARSKMDDPSRADDMRIFKDAEAALRALKGGDA